MKKWMSRIIVAFASIALVISLLNVSGIEAQAAVKKPTSITLKTTNKTVDINGKVTVSVKSVKPANASKAVTYKSSNKNVATVSAKGVVTGKKAGTATITATSKANKKVKATIKITVKDIKPTSLTLNISKASGFMGATKTVKATVKPANSSQKVYYSTSNKKVATVTTAGKITYVGPGEATITARSGQKNAKGNYIKKTVKVTVKDRTEADIDWQYVTPEELFESLENGENLTVLDIRPETIDGTAVGYADGHIEGSLWVPSWPVDTIAKQNALRATQVDEALKDNKAPIVIVCRSGQAGAKRAISVLKGFEGIDASRMYILEGGGTALVNNYSDKLVKGVEDFTGKYVISPAELKAKMDAGKKLKLVDTRGINNKTTTIKGAITMVWQQISRSPKTDGTASGAAGFARTLNAAKISKELSALGLGKNDQIILISDGYVTGGWGDDGRVLWQLQQCGYKNVKMLNGGVSAMKAECGNKWKNYSQTGPSKAVKKTVKVTSVNQGLNGITTANLLKLYKNKANFKVVDVRSNAEFEGAVLYGEKSGGHLKNALHIRFTDLFRVDGTLKSVSELTKMFEAAGLKKTDKIITYCTGGIRSAYMQLVLEMCGFENSFNYAESAYRWSNTKSAGTASYWTKLCNLTGLKFVEETLNLSYIGDSDKLTAILTPVYTTETVSYSTSNKAVATVDKKGVVTAKGYGNAVITVKSSKTGKKDTVKVTVKAPEAVAEKQVFVSPEYVKAVLDGQLPESENLLVAEVSWGAYASASAYKKAHVPGAVHINSDAVEYDDCDPWPYGDGIDDLAQYGDEYHYGANPVAPEDNFNIRNGEQLTQFMKTYGITQDTNVILYGNNASNSAVTRVAFAMLYAGVDNVKVMDGGFAAWSAAGLPTESKVIKPVATTEDFGVTIPEHPEYIMSIEEVQENLENNKNFNLVSIRSRDEFEGKTSGYGYIDFAGEPEGAIWGKDTDDGTYVQNGKVADISALKQYVEEGGGSYDNELSFYCGTGWRATIPFLMAYQDGKEDISLYDGGWWLWTVKQKEEASKYPVQTITPEQAARFASIDFVKDVVAVNGLETAVENELVIKYQRTDLNVSYTSDNEAVATVDANGNVTINGYGKAVITASVEGDDRTASYTVKVNAVKEDVLSYGTDNDDSTVLVDARLADVYQGWAVDGNEDGGHLEGAVNVSAQWLDCSYSSNKKENKTREEHIQKELDALGMTADKKYIVYDTNGKDADEVADYLKELGFANVSTYNAADLVKEADLVSYENYDLWIPAEVVKNISDYVVNGSELSDVAKDVVNGQKVVILDVSWGTVEESGFLDGHVPGSVHVNTDDYETPKVYIQEKDELYRSEWRLNSDEELLSLAAKSGITKDSCVIITGYENMATTRMGIILKYLGCDNVHVMSEGMVGWDALGYAYETGAREPKAVESFGVTKPQNPDLIDTIDEAKAKVGSSDYQLIDTRTIEEWDGTSSGYSYHDLMGRLEGTIHSPSGIGYSSSMYYYRNPDKSMRSKEVLEAMWKEQGIDVDKHMAFFCGSGWRAAEETWDAMAIGYTDVSLYSDGWIGWSNEGHPYLDKDGNLVHYDKTTNSVVAVK